jgi:hypothetical protein
LNASSNEKEVGVVLGEAKKVKSREKAYIFLGAPGESRTPTSFG